MLRAETSSGDSYDDPSEDLLFELLSDIERGDEEFVIVARLDVGNDETYVQALKVPDGYLVERREGSEAQHFHVVAADLRTAHQIMTWWAFRIAGWEAAPWQPGMA